MPADLTPMMRQYIDIKEAHSDCIVMYRLGDFYEMFFEDAVIASKELEIVLTGRDCGLDERAPMCGVPYHAVEIYINKLIEKGYKVAICEQMTDPRESKGLVERDVIRIITPGTVIEDSMLSERRNNYIVSIFLYENRFGFAYCDVSTGSFTVFESTQENWLSELTDELARIAPSEIVANDALFLQELLIRRLQSAYYTQCYGNWAYELEGARARLLRHFNVASLNCYGCEDMPCAISAAGALLAYLEDTQKNSLSHIRSIRVLWYAASICRLTPIHGAIWSLQCPSVRTEAKKTRCCTCWIKAERPWAEGCCAAGWISRCKTLRRLTQG